MLNHWTRDSGQERARRRRVVLLGTAITLVLSGAFFWYQLLHPGCCDRALYVEMAHAFASAGLAGGHPGLLERPYFYPWLLSLLVQLGAAGSVALRVVNFLVLTSLYVYAAYALATAIARTDRIAWTAAFLMLCSNVYVLPYLGTTLSDGLYTILCMLWFAQCIELGRATHPAGQMSGVSRLITLALLAGLILVTRSAGVWVSAVSAVLIVRHVVLGMCSGRTRGASARAIAAVLAFFVPLLPQLWLNALHYGRVSGFPSRDIGQLQLIWGAQFLKYGTNMSGGPYQMVYPNPFAAAAETTAGIAWYTEHPLAAFATILVKFIGAFDYDYVLPYIYDLHPTYGPVARVASLSIMVLGVWGIVRYAISGGHPAEGPFFGWRYFPLLTLACWSAVTLTSAVELRFSLPMLAVFVCFCAHTVLQLPRRDRRSILALAASWLALLLPTLVVAWFVARQNVLAVG